MKILLQLVSLLTFALLLAAGAAALSGRPEDTRACGETQVQLDEGYGVSRCAY